MRLIFIFFILTLGAVAQSASTPSMEDQISKEKRRLEELFIWRMSEELKLPVEKETSFTNTIRTLNLEKSKLNDEVSSSLAALKKTQILGRSTLKKEMEKALKRYEKAWRNYGQLPILEINRLRLILGPEDLGRYLVAKAQMAEKLTALSASDAEAVLTESDASKK